MAKNPSRKATEPAVTPTATIRVMIVCVPGDLPHESLTAHELGRTFGVRGTLSPRFWASPALHRWQRSQMFGLRTGRPAYCAGGPARLLDLTGMRQAAGVGAGIRHHLFSRVVHGTRTATPWHVYEALHLEDPLGYPWHRAVADFHDQPRVNAIRMYNAATYGAGQIGLQELEMYQAGCLAYQHHSALTAVAGDALIPADGAKLAPASDAMADRVTYLDQAHRLLTAIDPDQRLLAVAL
jgi:hypothetical protein